MINKKDLFPIGIGTWGIGGYAELDPNNDDEKQIKALIYMLENGMNFVEMCYFYSEGRAVELFVESLSRSRLSREDIFIVASVYPYKNETIKEAESEIGLLLELFNTSYFDSVQFSCRALEQWGFEKTIDLQKKLLKMSTTRSVSITNADLVTTKKYKENFNDKFFSHGLHFSFELRETEDLGLIEYSEQNDIVNVVYQSLRRNNTGKRNWPLLVELSRKYNKTQNQIIMNWLVSRGFLPITKSETIEHIDEILRSLDFEIDQSDLQRINVFRPPGWITPEIDWYGSEKGTFIGQLPNIFDEVYDKKRPDEK